MANTATMEQNAAVAGPFRVGTFHLCFEESATVGFRLPQVSRIAIDFNPVSGPLRGGVPLAATAS